MEMFLNILLISSVFFVGFFFYFRKKRRILPSTLSDSKKQNYGLGLGEKLSELFSQKGKKVEEGLLELEEVLIEADVGLKTTGLILSQLRANLSSPFDLDTLKGQLKEILLRILKASFQIEQQENKPKVCLIVGVNGVGKTTTLGKIAFHVSQKNKKVMLVAADTFRAGASQQLKVWANRVGCAFVEQASGADPSAVAFDGVRSAIAKKLDYIFVDTAGRLHSKTNLMEELKKIKRVVGKAMPGAPHEILLVVDATSGQNAVRQAIQFHEALGLSGVVLTKLDSTAKGGTVVEICNELDLPITYVGLGEGIADLAPFEPEQYVEALLA